MDRNEAISEAVRQSQCANGDRRYAVMWRQMNGGTNWTVEARKPSLAGECLLAVDGRLEHA